MEMNDSPVCAVLVNEVRSNDTTTSITINCAPPNQHKSIKLNEGEFLITSRGQDLSDPDNNVRFVLVYICSSRMNEYLDNNLGQFVEECFQREACDSLDELTELVSKWADEHIPDRTPTDALTKMVMEEIPELITSDFDPLEVADVGLIFLDFCHLLGINLGEVILEKMEINKNRKWAVNSDTGLLNHVKE